MTTGYADQVGRLTGKNPAKEHGMSDGDQAYRQGLKKVFGCDNLMCWFHVCQAVRDWLGKHAKVESSDKGTLWTQIVKPDLDEMHFSSSPMEFRSKAEAILQHWDDMGVTAATTWRDRLDNEHSLSSYFRAQWLEVASEWHWGHNRLLPSTNT